MSRLTAARCFTRGAPLARTVANARSIWERRDGLLFELVLDDDYPGQGEASPLPGYSSDSLADCRAALTAGLGVGLTGGGEGGTSFADWLAVTAEVRAALPPAARAAFETALLDALGRQLGRPAWALLGAPDAPAPRPLSALLHGATAEAVAAEARAAAELGIGCLKLKVGRPGELGRELALAAAVRAAAPATTLRLDANRGWSLAEAREAAARFAALGCGLLEEPTYELSLAAAAAGDPAARRTVRELARLPLPIGLDESLAEAPSGALVAVAGDGFPAAIVLKPMLLGGFARSLALGAVARRLGLEVVVTHTFDGPLGWMAAAALALVAGTPGTAVGLAPHPGLGAWPPRELPALTATAIVPWAPAGLGLAPFRGEEFA